MVAVMVVRIMVMVMVRVAVTVTGRVTVTVLVIVKASVGYRCPDLIVQSPLPCSMSASKGRPVEEG